MTISQLCCPFCGRNKPIKADSRLREMDIDPSDWGVISIRATGPGPGRGHKGVPGEGLHTIARLTLIEALQEPEYEVIAEDVRQRMITILKSYVASGLIEHDEIF